MSFDKTLPDTGGQSHWGLIDRIYETGQSPRDWPLLVDSLFSSFAFDENSDFTDSAEFDTSLQELWPHFERALSLNSHIDGVAGNMAASVATDFPYPLVVVSDTLDIVYRNVDGTRHFPPQSGIEARGRKVVVTKTDVANKLSALMTAARGGTAEGLVTLLYRDEKANNHLVAISLPRMSGDRLLALGWLDPADQGRLTTEHFRQLYDMTDAESKVLHHILCGKETNEVADLLSIAPPTVRAHLKSVYRKTSTTGKSDLIQTIRCGPALLSRFLAPRSEMYADTEDADSRRSQTMTLSDGRQLGFAEFGACDGTPILLVHNLIGSRLQLPTSEENLITQKLRLIVPDRPGVGLSDIHAPHSLREWSSDIEQLADHLQIGKFDLIGSSIGAIYGLALAHHRPDRIRRFAMVSCLAEIVDLKTARHLMPSTCRLIVLARYAPSLLAIILKFVVRKGPEAYLDKLVCNLPQLDQRLYEDPAFNRMMVRAVSETLHQGTASILDDIRLISGPWRIAPESIRIPVQYWHGLDDDMAPHSIVRAFADRIPDCKQHLVENESHWLIFRQWNAIVAELLRPTGSDPTYIKEQQSVSTNSSSYPQTDTDRLS